MPNGHMKGHLKISAGSASAPTQSPIKGEVHTTSCDINEPSTLVHLGISSSQQHVAWKIIGMILDVCSSFSNRCAHVANHPAPDASPSFRLLPLLPMWSPCGCANYHCQHPDNDGVAWSETKQIVSKTRLCGFLVEAASSQSSEKVSLDFANLPMSSAAVVNLGSYPQVSGSK